MRGRSKTPLSQAILRRRGLSLRGRHVIGGDRQLEVGAGAAV